MEIMEPRRGENHEEPMMPAKDLFAPPEKPSRPSLLRGENPQDGVAFAKVRSVISLPGVPKEMETLLTEAVVPYLQRKFDLHEVLKIRTLHVSGLGEGMIDDRVGDLELLTNPTVGLTAHSGIVDVRIAAKAGTEGEAQKMIAAVEQDVRTRLGDHVYGADDDTLEKAALDAAAKRGWTVACFESNLAGTLQTRLGRSAHPAYRGGSQEPVRAEALAERTETARRSWNASAALGVHLSQSGEKQEIFIVILHGSHTVNRTLTYGGHPGNAPRWAVNMALDLFRRTAREAA
jgi:hypothetical protein